MYKRRKFRVYDSGKNSSSSWKTQKENKPPLLAKVVLFVLGIFIIYLVISAFFLVNLLTNSFKHMEGPFSNEAKIDFYYRTNFLILNYRSSQLKELGILSVSKSGGKALLVTINPQSLVVGTDGKSFQSVFLNNGKTSLDNLKASVLISCGVSTDSYLAFNNGENWLTQKNLAKLDDLIYSPYFFLKIGEEKKYLDQTLSSNLTPLDLNKLLGELKSIGIRNQNFVDLTANKGEKGYFDKSSFETKMGLYLSDSLLAKEGSVVEINNGSGNLGLGSVYSDVLTNLGASVLDSVEGVQVKTTRVLSRNKNNRLAKRLSEIFDVKIENLAPSDSNGLDVKLILGQDVGRYFNF